MKNRILSLLCAAVLQLVPLARVVHSTAQAVLPESTIVFRLVIGAVAALGAFDAVSGASTIITSPNNATGTIGQVFSYRITVGPRSANVFRAAPLPDGLYMDRSYIRGTPTTVGETRVRLTASDGGHSVSKWITIYILPPPDAAPPFFVAQPSDQDALPGEITLFHSSALSVAPVAVQWRSDPRRNEQRPHVRQLSQCIPRLLFGHCRQHLRVRHQFCREAVPTRSAGRCRCGLELLR